MSLLKLRSFYLKVVVTAAMLNIPGILPAQPLTKTEQILLKKNFAFFNELISSNTLPDPGGKKAHAEISNCDNSDCLAGAFAYSDSEISKTGDLLADLYFKTPALQKIIQKLKQNGSYALFDTLPDTAYLRRIWRNDADGVNNIIAVYLKGRPPVYPRIDSISFTPSDPGFIQQARLLADDLLKNREADNGTLITPLYFAVKLLTLNGRDEAARYEPLYEGGNREPYTKVRQTDWERYEYSAILVPGMGPEISGVRLAPEAATRCDSAVLRFKQGKAPFIVVSGGHVHPYKTPVCEAVEMKKYLVEKHGIPAAAVFIEPYARHTTTNLRNLNRMVYQFQMPPGKKILVVTDTAQTKYINGNMSRTAMRDLKYLPYQNMKRIGPWETVYEPSRLSLMINPYDPLDP